MEAIKKTIYICDPEKNTECKKTSCWKKGGLCNCTAKPECAALHENGQPMKAKTEDYQPFDIIAHHKQKLTLQNVNDYSISLNPENIMLVSIKNGGEKNDRKRD